MLATYEFSSLVLNYNSENNHFRPYVGKAKMCLTAVTSFLIFKNLFTFFSCLFTIFQKKLTVLKRILALPT